MDVVDFYGKLVGRYTRTPSIANGLIANNARVKVATVGEGILGGWDPT